MHVLLGPVSVRDHHLVPGSTLAEQIKHINAEFVRGQPTDADRKELTELLEEMQENQSGTPQRKWIDGFSYEQISDALQEGAFIGEQIGWAHQRYQLLKEAREAPKLKDDLLNSSSGGGGGGGGGSGNDVGEGGEDGYGSAEDDGGVGPADTKGRKEDQDRHLWGLPMHTLSRGQGKRFEYLTKKKLEHEEMCVRYKAFYEQALLADSSLALQHAKHDEYGTIPPAF